MKNDKPFLLEDFSFLVTDRLDIAEIKFNQSFQPRNFSLIDKEQSPNINISLARLPFSNIFAGCFGCNINAIIKKKVTDYHLFVPVRGEILYQGETNHNIKPGNALLVSPGSKLNITWIDNCYGISVVTRKEIIHDLAGRLFGKGVSSQIILPQEINLSVGVGLSIANALQTILSELEDEHSLLSLGITTKAQNELLLTTILNTGNHSNREASTDQAPTVLIGKAMNYIQGNLEKPISLNELSQACKASPRTLQSQFKKYFNSSPMAIINLEKLKKVRSELLAACTGNTQVADIAAKYGFFHASNFSRIYKKTFGVSPSVTLNS